MIPFSSPFFETSKFWKKARFQQKDTNSFAILETFTSQKNCAYNTFKILYHVLSEKIATRCINKQKGGSKQWS